MNDIYHSRIGNELWNVFAETTQQGRQCVPDQTLRVIQSREELWNDPYDIGETKKDAKIPQYLIRIDQLGMQFLKPVGKNSQQNAARFPLVYAGTSPYTVVKRSTL